MMAYFRNIAKVLLLLLAANSETQIFSSKTQLASHLLQFRAAATKTRLADKVSCSQPPFSTSQLSIVGWGGSELHIRASILSGQLSD